MLNLIKPQQASTHPDVKQNPLVQHAPGQFLPDLTETPPTFGSLSTVIDGIRSHNLYNSSLKEVLGSNIPRLLMVSNENDRQQQVIGQLGWTTIHLGVGLGASHLIDAGLNHLAPALNHQIAQTPKAQSLWWLGKSLALASLTGSLLIALPNVRNAIMYRKTGMTRFSDIVGVGKKTPDPPAVVQTGIEKNNRQAKSTVLAGLATCATLLGGTLAAIKHGIHLPENAMVTTLAQKLTLPKGEYGRMNDAWAVLAWGLPGSYGLWRARSDEVEKQEILLGTAMWLLSFTVIPRKIEQGVLNWAQGRHWPGIGGPDNIAWLGQLASSLVLYTALPGGVALLTRKKRAQAEGSSTPTQPAKQPPYPRIIPSAQTPVIANWPTQSPVPAADSSVFLPNR